MSKENQIDPREVPVCVQKFDKEGREIPDPTPVAVPLGFGQPPTLEERMRRMIAVEMSRAAQQVGMETFSEADDFETGDDEPVPMSPHELTLVQEEAVLPDPDQEVLDKGKVVTDEASLREGRDRRDPGAAGGEPAAGGSAGSDGEPDLKDGVRGGDPKDRAPRVSAKGKGAAGRVVK